jgi:hypothetical protein
LLQGHSKDAHSTSSEGHSHVFINGRAIIDHVAPRERWLAAVEK